MEFEDFELDFLEKNRIEKHWTPIFKKIADLGISANANMNCRNFDSIEHDIDLLSSVCLEITDFINNHKNKSIVMADGTKYTYLGEKTEEKTEDEDNAQYSPAEDDDIISESDYIDDIDALYRKLESLSLSMSDIKNMISKNEISEAMDSDSSLDDDDDDDFNWGM